MAQNQQRADDGVSLGNSPIADLASHTDEATVRAATQPAPVNFSGQYLYDRFVANDGEELTKLGIVRTMVAQLDTMSFKHAMSAFIEVATGFVENAKTPELKRAAEARLKTARNHQTVMRAAYGALKFAMPELLACGYDERTTGYQVMRVIAKQALEDRKLKWDGSPASTPQERQDREANKAEAQAFLTAKSQSPRLPDETTGAYYERLAPAIDNIMKAEKAAKHDEIVATMVKELKEKAGDLLPDVLNALMQ